MHFLRKPASVTAMTLWIVLLLNCHPTFSLHWMVDAEYESVLLRNYIFLFTILVIMFFCWWPFFATSELICCCGVGKRCFSFLSFSFITLPSCTLFSLLAYCKCLMYKNFYLYISVTRVNVAFVWLCMLIVLLVISLCSMYILLSNPN